MTGPPSEPVPLPPGIGPHEGRELALMRAGTKHVALFFELEPPELDAMRAAGFGVMRFPQASIGPLRLEAWIVFRDRYGADAQRLKKLVLDPPLALEAAHEHEIGRILGYRPEDVDAFLRHAAGTP